MSAERSSPMLRGSLWTAGVLVGLLGLYVLGMGPAIYHQRSHTNSYGAYGSLRAYLLLRTMYAPLNHVRSPLAKPLTKYYAWWFQQAEKNHPLPPVLD
jgi:hypothetical protein